MKKLVLLLGLPLFLSTGMVFGKTVVIDRFIFFGDSLSDTGNFPEPANLSPLPKTWPSNAWIPVSNPVDSRLYGKAIRKFPTWKYPDRRFLRKSSTNLGKIKFRFRRRYSIIWTQYFVYNFFRGRGHDLIPAAKILWRRRPILPTTSVNFAWAGAMTLGTYATSKWKFLDGQSIYTLRRWNRLYRKAMDKAERDYILQNVPVPNLQTQLQYFFTLLQRGTIPHNDRTAYVIFIGANDMGKLLLRDFTHFHWLSFFGALGSEKNPGDIINSIKKAVATLKRMSPQSPIFVLTPFPPSMTPFVANLTFPPTRWAATWGANMVYRRLIKQYEQAFEKMRYRNIFLVPMGTFIHDYWKTYPEKLQKAMCQYDSYALSCWAPGGQNFFFWDQFHMTTQVHQYMAKKMMAFLIGS